jgi:hypothetical protein
MANFADLFVDVFKNAIELSKDGPPYFVFSLFFTTFIGLLGFVSSTTIASSVQKLIAPRFTV